MADPLVPSPKTSESKSQSFARRCRCAGRHHVLHFTPSWFSVNMGTGISAILLHQMPYTNSGLRIVATIIFILNIALFCIFFIMTVLRYTVWPRILKTMLQHEAQSLFLGTLPMGFATLVNLTVFIAVPAYGISYVHLAEALWWIDVFLTILVGLIYPVVIYTRHRHELGGINGVMLQPFVAAVVAAASGGIVASVQDPNRARTIILASYCILGFGLPVAMLIMALYLLRLITHIIPPKEQIVSVFLPLGPCGQGAFALIQLAVVNRHLAYDNSPPLFLPEVSSEAEGLITASALYVVSLVSALLLWGFGLFWLVGALGMLLVTGFQEKRLPFNLGWWGFTFPLGVYAAATNLLGTNLNSTPFKIIGEVFSIAVVLLWLLVATMTARRVGDGSIFVAPCLSPYDGEAPNARRDDKTQV